MADEQMTKNLVEGGTFGLAGTMYGQLAMTLGAIATAGHRCGTRPPRRGGAIAGGSGGMNPALGQLIAVLRAQADSLEQALDLTERQTDAIVRRELDRINQLSQTLEHEVVEGRKLEERRYGFAAELADALGHGRRRRRPCHARRRAAPQRGNALLRAGETVIRSIEKLARRSVANRQLLEHELTVIDQVMRIAHRGDRSTYAGTGTYSESPIAILDARA